MGKYFSTSQTPIVDFKYKVPVEAIAMGLKGRQDTWNQEESLIDESFQLVDQVKHITGTLGEEYGDVEAAQSLQNKYDSLLEQGLSEIGDDYSKAGKLRRKIEQEVRRDFGANGLAGALESRYGEFVSQSENLSGRIEEGNLGEIDKMWWASKLNPLSREDGSYNSLGSRTITNRPDLNKAFLEFINAHPEKKDTYFTKGSGPTTGYILKDNISSKQFMEEMQSYFYTIPGAAEAMQRDLEIGLQNPAKAEAYSRGVTGLRVQYLRDAEKQLSDIETMRKNPKSFGVNEEMLNRMEEQALQIKESYNDPNSDRYISDESLLQDFYVMSKTMPFAGMEYENHEESITVDWMQQANYNDLVIRRRDKDRRDAELADANNIFMGPSQINSSQVEETINNLPKVLLNSRNILSQNKKEASEFTARIMVEYSGKPLDFTTPQGIQEARDLKLKTEGLLQNYSNAQIEGNAQQYLDSLPSKDKEFVVNNYNKYLIHRETLAHSQAQVMNAQNIIDAVIDKEAALDDKDFNSVYENYRDRFYSYNKDSGNKRDNLSLTKEEYFDYIYTGKVPSRVNLSDSKQLKPLQFSTDKGNLPNLYKFSKNDAQGLSNTVAWSKGLDASIIKQAEEFLTSTSLASFSTVDGQNAGRVAEEYFGKKGTDLVYNVIPVVGPTSSFGNALEVKVSSKNSGKKPLTLTVDAGEMNKPIFVDMFYNMMKSGLSEGNNAMVDNAALGIFANRFSNDMSYALAKAGEGAPIELPLGGGVRLLLEPHEDKYKIRTIDNGVLTDYMETPGAPGIDLKTDLNGAMIEIGKYLYMNN